jgi:hypothetical protein
MFGCNRSSTDPLVRIILKKYHLHLLQWPREGIEPGHIVIDKGNGTTLCVPPGVIFANAPPSTTIKRSKMTDLEETFSSKVEAKAAIGLVEQIATLFGGTTGNLKSAYEGASTVRMRIGMSERREFSPAGLADFVSKARLHKNPAVFSESDKLYVINSVAAARTIEIVALDSKDAKLEMEAKSLGVGSADGSFKAVNHGGAGVSYEGTRALPFGVELLKLENTPDGWKLVGAGGYVPVRGGEDQFPDEAFAFIGDAQSGPVEIDLVLQ